MATICYLEILTYFFAFKHIQRVTQIKILLLTALCIFQIALQAQNLEEKIYTATETFISNKNSQSFNVLEKEETDFKNQVS